MIMSDSTSTSCTESASGQRTGAESGGVCFRSMHLKIVVPRFDDYRDDPCGNTCFRGEIQLFCPGADDEREFDKIV